jgi:tripartite-type tricarboxylate transporter receptor subunit TctC
MILGRRSALRLLAGAAALPGASRIAKAQNYPTRPVRIVVGFPPAGIGTSPHVSGELLKMMAGIDMMKPK